MIRNILVGMPRPNFTHIRAETVGFAESSSLQKVNVETADSESVVTLDVVRSRTITVTERIIMTQPAGSLATVGHVAGDIYAENWALPLPGQTTGAYLGSPARSLTTAPTDYTRETDNLPPSGIGASIEQSYSISGGNTGGLFWIDFGGSGGMNLGKLGSSGSPLYVGFEFWQSDPFNTSSGTSNAGGNMKVMRFYNNINLNTRQGSIIIDKASRLLTWGWDAVANGQSNENSTKNINTALGDWGFIEIAIEYLTSTSARIIMWYNDVEVMDVTNTNLSGVDVNGIGTLECLSILNANPEIVSDARYGAVHISSQRIRQP